MKILQAQKVILTDNNFTVDVKVITIQIKSNLLSIQYMLPNQNTPGVKKSYGPES